MEESDHNTSANHTLFGDWDIKNEVPRRHSAFKEIFGLILIFSLACFATTILFNWLHDGMPLEPTMGKSVTENVINEHNYQEPSFVKLKASK